MLDVCFSGCGGSRGGSSAPTLCAHCAQRAARSGGGKGAQNEVSQREISSIKKTSVDSNGFLEKRRDHSIAKESGTIILQVESKSRVRSFIVVI